MATKRALITGIGGGLARLVAERLYRDGYELIGVDYRDPGRLELPATVYKANYNKTKIEDVFRRHEPTDVFHLGRVGNLKERAGKRFDLNVVGSRKVMELSVKVGVRRLVVLSTFHIYGAHPHNHIPIYEDEPLRAGAGFPQIADAIQLDNQAVTFAYQHPELKTAILRPTHVVGPRIANAISSLLRQRRVPNIVGFDPMVQFVHQDDLADAIVAVARADGVGVFNVAGPHPVPLHRALHLTGAEIVPIPAPIAVGYLELMRLFAPTLPSYLVNFFKYPCVISDARLRQTADWKPTVTAADAIIETVRAQPKPEWGRGR